MIEVYRSKDLTLEICQESRKLAKEAKACKDSYVPFIKALRKKDLEECVAIINGEYFWLIYDRDILPEVFVLNGRAIKYYSNGQKREERTYLYGKLHGKYEAWYENGNKSITLVYEMGKLK